MAPKTTEEAKNNTLTYKWFQKISAIRNGRPVCPEKNKSLPEVIKSRSLDSRSSFVGYGPM